MNQHRLDLQSWLVWGTALILVFAGLGGVPLLNNNEGLYAEIPREMLASGDWRNWIIPTLNGLPYMEKPPLLYWLTAAGFALFGTAEWVARLVPALSSLACVAMLQRFGRLTGHATEGKLAALIFVSGTGVLAMSRVLMFDMLLTALLTAALFQVWLFLEQGKLRHLRWAYAALGLAVLTKGLVALVLFGMVAIAALFVARDGFSLRRLRSLFDPMALLIFALVVVPWHVAASVVEPAFARFYFYNEHVLRFFGKRQPHDYYGGPWWYYLPRMAIYLFPWIILLLLRLAPPRADDSSLRLRRFMLLAWLLPLMFFSFSRAKANYYLVAVMPFAAMHLALLAGSRNWFPSRMRLAPALALLAICIALGLAAGQATPRPGFNVLGLNERDFVLLMLAGGGVIAGLGLLAVVQRPQWLISGTLAVALWIALGLGLALPGMEEQLSSRGIAQMLQQRYPAHRVVLAYEFEKQSTLPFYLGQPVPVVESASADLYWGARLRANDLMWDQARFHAHARQEKLAVVVTEEYRRSFESWKGQLLQPVFRGGLATVYVN